MVWCILRKQLLKAGLPLKKQFSSRPPGGGRFLLDPKKVYDFNNWDNVVWDEEQEADARKKTEEQLKSPLEADKQVELEENADNYWDKFYNEHQNRFFKDRHWLFTEFPELAPKDFTSSLNVNSSKTDSASEQSVSGATGNTAMGGNSDQIEDNSVNIRHIDDLERNTDVSQTDSVDTHMAFPGEKSTTRVWEVGCGVGNTVFPVLQTNNDPRLMVYCCDFSSTAVGLVKDHPDYDPRRCTAFVCDIANEKSEIPFPKDTVDVIILIFVLSAIHPDKMQYVINRLASYLKPGGKLLFRDYGRYDMAQLRFKKGRCLSENFYVRGDGTRVYFFTQEEIGSLCTAAGLREAQNLVDRRLQVNRGRQLKMYRVWIQCKYTKPAVNDLTDVTTNNSTDTTDTAATTATR